MEVNREEVNRPQRIRSVPEDFNNYVLLAYQEEAIGDNEDINIAISNGRRKTSVIQNKQVISSKTTIKRKKIKIGRNEVTVLSSKITIHRKKKIVWGKDVAVLGVKNMEVEVVVQKGVDKEGNKKEKGNSKKLKKKK